MIPQLMKAMSKYLREHYPEYPVYNNYPEEMELPCFIVRTTGGNLRRRIRQTQVLRGLSIERFTIEFYSLDVNELLRVEYELRVLLDTIEVDNGDLYRCYNKNTMMALTEQHFSLTFNIRTTPYVNDKPLTKMNDLDFNEYVN